MKQMFDIKKTFKNEKLLLKFAKKDLSKVPYYELAECLEKNKITITFAKKQFSKYPIVKQLIPILNNKISELDLKIFEGELHLGQDIKYFEEYYNTKRSSQSKSSSGTRTELIAEGISNKINREVQALILKFENDKLISFDDKRDVSTIWTNAVNPNNFEDLFLLKPSQTLKFIITKNISKEFNYSDLEKFIIKSWKEDKVGWKANKIENIIDVLNNLKIIDKIDNTKLYKLLISNYPKKKFIDKLISLSKESKGNIDYNNLLNLYVNHIKLSIIDMNKKFKSNINKSTFYVDNGSSMLCAYFVNPFMDFKSSLLTYEVDKEGFQYLKSKVYSTNQYIDLTIKELKTYLKLLSVLNNINQFDNVNQCKKIIEIALSKFDETKKISETKAKGLKKENNGNKALGCGFILLILVILFWLISYII